MRISDSYILKTPADCSFQIDGKMRHLGLYDDAADAARASDKVARVLGRPLNFPGNDEMEVAEGPRSEGADQAVADAVEAAKTFMDKQAAENDMQATEWTEWAKRAAERAKHAAEVQSQSCGHRTDSRHTNPQLSRFLEQMESSEYTGVYPNRYNQWLPQISVSQSIENI